MLTDREQTGYGRARKITLLHNIGAARRASCKQVTTEDWRGFGLRATVRLLNQHGAIPAGALGSVMGWFVDERTYVVNFADEGARVAEVQPDEIVSAELS